MSIDMCDICLIEIGNNIFETQWINTGDDVFLFSCFMCSDCLTEANNLNEDAVGETWSDALENLIDRIVELADTEEEEL